MSDFQREERYIVIKRKHLFNDFRLEARLRKAMREVGVKPIEAVVIESDWPEYETVWRMIEARVSGQPVDYEDVRDWVENGCPEGVAGMPENVQAILDAIADLRARNEALLRFIEAPPGHRFWGAGEPDCPKDIKAGNGELHTLRCKECGADNPRDQICRAGLAANREG